MFGLAKIARILHEDAVAINKQRRAPIKTSRRYFIPDAAVSVVAAVVLHDSFVHCASARSTSAQITCPVTMWIC